MKANAYDRIEAYQLIAHAPADEQAELQEVLEAEGHLAVIERHALNRRRESYIASTLKTINDSINEIAFSRSIDAMLGWQH